jgi:putative toxin-antitoxin system antitoxin component (TIGR02293 family)
VAVDQEGCPSYTSKLVINTPIAGPYLQCAADDFPENLAYNQFKATVRHTGEATRNMKSRADASAAADTRRIDRVEKATRMAEAIFESNDMALNWMRRENIALGNARPIDLCNTDAGAAQVRLVLSAIEHGNAV